MITEKYNKLVIWVKENAPEEYSKLREPVKPEFIDVFKKAAGFDLPEELKLIYQINDGSLGNFVGLDFLSLAKVINEIKSWEQTRKDDEENKWDLGQFATSYPEGAIRKEYSDSKWIPVFYDGGGNYIGIDLNPDEKGVVGQVINFGRDEDDKFVVANNLESYFDLLLRLIDEGKIIYITDKDDWEINGLHHLTDGLKSLIVVK